MVRKQEVGDVKEEGMTSEQWPIVNNDMTLLHPNKGKGIHWHGTPKTNEG